MNTENIVELKTVLVRLATLADTTILARMQADAWEAAFSQPLHPLFKRLYIIELECRWQQQFKQETSIFLLICHNALRGVMSYQSHFDEVHSKSIGEIKAMLFMPDQQNDHFANLLYAAIRDDARQKQLQEMHVWLVSSDIHTQQRYEALGFNSTTEYREEHLDKKTSVEEICYKCCV